MEKQPERVRAFMTSLEKAATREVELVRILPLYGHYYDLHSVEDAITFIKDYKEDASTCKVIKYEVEIRYNNGDCIRGQFAEKDVAIQFLRRHQSTSMTPADSA